MSVRFGTSGVDRGPTPRPAQDPALREALREALTADRDRFRRTVRELAAEYGFDAERLDADPASFDPPAAVGALEAPDRPPVWRAWALEEAPLGLVVAGAAYHDNPVLYANRATRRLTGHSLAGLCGENLRLLQGPETDPGTVDTLRTALRNWNGVTVELRNYTAEGTPFTNRVTLVPVPGADGTVGHWFGLQAAVTEE